MTIFHCYLFYIVFFFFFFFSLDTIRAGRAAVGTENIFLAKRDLFYRWFRI